MAFWRLVIRESLRSFEANRSLQTAATLAYFGFLSLMPMLLLAVFLLGLLVSSSERALDALAEAVASVFPTFDAAKLQDIAMLAKQKAWGAVSVVVLAWSMTPFAGAMRGAMLGIFKTEVKLHFVKAKLRDLAAVFWLMTFFVLFAGSRLALGSLHALPEWINLLDWIVPPVVTAVALAALYRVFAPLKLLWWELMCGGIAASLLLTVMRPLFGLILRFNPGFGYAFGSLKAIFLLLVWVYYLFAVILLGAEIMANVHRRESLLLRKLFTAPAGQKIGPLLERFVKPIPAGATLFNEGDAGAEMFYVLDGEVELKKGGLVVKTAKAGDYFGEMSLLLSAPRTASAAARGEARVVVISRDNFETILRESPSIVMSLLREMGQRLKATTDSFAGQNRP